MTVTEIYDRHPITFQPNIHGLNSMENPIEYVVFVNKKAMITASFYVTRCFYSLGSKENSWPYFSNDHLKIRHYTESQLTVAGWLENRTGFYRIQKEKLLTERKKRHATFIVDRLNEIKEMVYDC